MIKFKDMRDFISIVDRISVCMKETQHYENYQCMKAVPDTYDEMFLHGIGITKSEFYDADGALQFKPCLEVVLSKEPKIMARLKELEEQAQSGRCTPIEDFPEEGLLL